MSYRNDYPAYNMKILLESFNAQVKGEREFVLSIIRHTLDSKTNDNGRKLINFADMHGREEHRSHGRDHKDGHKQIMSYTRRSAAIQIDHILVSNRHFSSVEDVRSYRGLESLHGNNEYYTTHNAAR